MGLHRLDIECAFDKPHVVPVYSLPGMHELLESLLSFPDERYDISVTISFRRVQKFYLQIIVIRA